MSDFQPNSRGNPVEWQTAAHLAALLGVSPGYFARAIRPLVRDCETRREGRSVLLHAPSTFRHWSDARLAIARRNDRRPATAEQLDAALAEERLGAIR